MAPRTRQSSKRLAKVSEASTRFEFTLPSPALTPEKSFFDFDDNQPNKNPADSIRLPVSPISPEILLPTCRPSWLSSSNKRVTTRDGQGSLGDDRAIGVQALLDLQSKASAVDILMRGCMLKFSDDSIKDEEGTSDCSTSDEEETSATITTTHYLSCHGNTFRTLEPHRGSALWELTGQPDPAESKSKVIPPETRSGELDCPRCSRFERLRNKNHVDASKGRESTVTLSEDAEDNIQDRRTGAAKYDDARHERAVLPGLTPHQLKRQKRYVRVRNMTEEERAQWEAGLPAQREQRQKARDERAYEDMIRAREADIIQRSAINRARRVQEQATRVVKPRVSFRDYVASLPAPDPKSLESYRNQFVPSVEITTPPVASDTASKEGTETGFSGARKAPAPPKQKRKRPLPPLPSPPIKIPRRDNNPLAPSKLRK